MRRHTADGDRPTRASAADEGVRPTLGLLLALCTVVASAQTQSVVELARAAPPEFFADAVIKLAERGDIPASGQRALLEEAFDAAKHAHEPVRLRAVTGVRPNTRAALRDSAGGLGLDALSLESRVIKLIAVTDRTRALELFQSLEHPTLEARPCEDPMIADASAYYETVGLIAAGQGPLLMLALGPANSPGELASFVKVLAANRLLPEDDRRLIAGALALKMETAAPDYRSFTMTADELRAGLEEIAALNPGATPARLAEGARKLVIVQMSSPRCNEEFGGAVRFIDWFNAKFRGKLEPIREEETWSKTTLGWLKAESYFESGDGKEIADHFAALRNGSRTSPAKIADFLREFSAWKPEGANIDVFHQKMTVLHGLYQLIPPGEDLDALIARVTQSLKSSGVEREYPAEWLLQVRSFAGSPGGDRAKLLAAFRESGDVGLAVFAALDGLPNAVPHF